MTGHFGAKHLLALLAISFVAWSAAEVQGKDESAPDYNVPQVKFINGEIRKVWSENQLVPSPPATDGEWCRRVFLDILGRTPSVEELRAFTASKEPQKKARLVAKLLNDEQYVEDY